MDTALVRDKITLEMKKFGFEWDYRHDKVKLILEDVKAGGLTIPQLSWSWIGLGLAQTVVSGIGGMIFNAIVEAIFGRSGKSMEQLLEEQLTAFANIIEQKLDEHELKVCIDDVRSFVQLFQEYTKDRTHGRLDFLTNQSALTLTHLERLGFPGYRTYMACAGLRLAVLQEVLHQRRRGKENFLAQRAAAIRHHVSMAELIDAETNGSAVNGRFPNAQVGVAGFGELVDISYGKISVLGKRYEGWFTVRTNDHTEYTGPTPPIFRGMFDTSKPRLFSSQIRKDLRDENTDQGDVIVKRWVQH